MLQQILKIGLLVGVVSCCFCKDAFSLPEPQAEHSTITFLFQCKDHFSHDYCFRGNRTVSFRLFDSLKSQPLEVWQNYETELIASLIPQYFKYNSISFRKTHGVIQDSTSLLFLISLLDLRDPRPPRRQLSSRSIDTSNWVNESIRWLVDCSSIPHLQQYSQLVSTKLVKCKAPFVLQSQLAALITLPDSIKLQIRQQVAQKLPKTALLTDQYLTGLWVLSRLSDTVAEKNVLNLVSTAQGFNDYSKLIEPLSFCGSDTCLKTLVRVFGQHIVNKEDPLRSSSRGYCVSLRDRIIIALARHFPEEEVFSPKRLSLFALKNFDCDTVIQNQYKKDFSAWVEKTFSRKLDLKFESIGPFLEGGCTEGFRKEFSAQCD